MASTSRWGQQPSADSLKGTFFVPKVPAEVMAAVPLFATLEQAPFRSILQAALEYMKAPAAVLESHLIDLQASTGIEGGAFGTLFTACHAIVHAAVHSRTGVQKVEEDLKRIGLPEKCVRDFAKALRNSRATLEACVFQQRVTYPRLDSLRWRVDVAISSSSLSRVLKPSILMQMHCSDGNIKTFEMPIEQFHQLRHSVATVLRDMKKLERHPIMRIATEADDRKKKKK